MNLTATNEGGWEATELRSWLRSEIYNTLPQDLKATIVSVNKTFYDYGSKSTLSCEDNLWIPSWREIRGGDSHENSGADYSGYFDGSSSRLKSTYWHLRSSVTDGPKVFCSITPTGYGTEPVYVSGNGSVNGVVIGFCI